MEPKKQSQGDILFKNTAVGSFSFLKRLSRAANWSNSLCMPRSDNDLLLIRCFLCQKISEHFTDHGLDWTGSPFSEKSSAVSCVYVLLLWPSILFTPCSCRACYGITFPKAKRERGRATWRGTLSWTTVCTWKLRGTVLTVLPEPVFLLITSSCGAWLLGIPLCEWKQTAPVLQYFAWMQNLSECSHVTHVGQGKENSKHCLRCGGRSVKLSEFPIH